MYSELRIKPMPRMEWNTNLRVIRKILVHLGNVRLKILEE